MTIEHPSITPLKKRVKDYVAEKGWGAKSELARRTGLTPQGISRIEESDWAPSTQTLAKLLKALDEIDEEEAESDLATA